MNCFGSKLSLFTIMFLFIISLCRGGAYCAPRSQQSEKPELVLNSNHGGEVSSLAYSPDGRYLASASWDFTVKIWDASGGEPIRVLSGHKYQISTVKFSPDGELVATASCDGTARIWEARTGRCVSILTHGNSLVQYCFFASAGKSLVTGTDDGRVLVWDLASRRCIKTVVEPSKGLNALELSPDGRYIVTVGKDSAARLWELSSGDCVNVYREIEKLCGPASFSPDGALIASISNEGSIVLWERESGSVKRKLKAPESSLGSLSFSINGRYLASGASTGSIYIWDMRSGDLSATLRESSCQIRCIAFSPDSTHLASGGRDGKKDASRRSIRIWNLKHRSCERVISGNSSQMRAIAFSPDGRSLAAVVEGFRILVKDVLTLRTVMTLKLIMKSNEMIQCLRFSPDGKYLVVSGSRGSIARWDCSDGRCVNSLADTRTMEQSVDSIAFSRDGSVLFTSIASGNILAWDLKDGRLIAEMKGQVGKINRMDVSPDGRYLASGGSQGVLNLWDISTGKLSRALQERGNDKFIYDLAFSPDGSRIAMVGSESENQAGDSRTDRQDSKVGTGRPRQIMKVWDLANGRSATVSDHIGSRLHFYYAVAFSPDSRYIAFGGLNTGIKIYDCEKSSIVRRLANQSSVVIELFYVPGRSLMLSAGHDGEIRLWSTDSWELLASLIHFCDDQWVTYTPEGYFDCSEKGKDYIGWTVGMSHYPFWHFYDEFYCPNLFTILMSGESIRKRHDLRRGFSIPPDLAIRAPGKGQHLDSESVEVQLQVTDRGGGVSDIRFYHQGKRIDGGKISAGKQEKDEVRTITFPVQLLKGANVIRAAAYSADHTVESRPAEVMVYHDEQEPPGGKAAGTQYVLAVGINRYRESLLDLGSARQDAEAVAACLRARCANMFRELNITTLYDLSATKENIIKALEDLKRKAGPADEVVLFFSGHGDISPGDDEYYFIPSDFAIKGDVGSMYRNGGVSAGALGTLCGDIKARKILVMFDSCHSGRAATAFQKMSEIKAIRMLAKSTGLHIATASTDVQTAGEVGDLGHGIFTYAILEGLSGKADSDKDSIITVLELLPFIGVEVERLSEKHMGRKQYPVTDSRGMDFPLVIP